MRAHILSIGSELILGHLTDTNATFLAQELVALGIELLHVTQVGDDLPRLVATLRHAAAEADLVVCTGGVGPTEDDLTREAIAAFVHQTPTVDPDLLAGIRAYFAARGLTMPERNAKQAWLIPAAEALPNPVGTAPGWFVRHDDTIVVAMPGVPREMYRMWREQVVPRLTPQLPARVIRTTTLKTLGIGESAVAHLLEDLIDRQQPVVATYAKDDGVHVRLTSIADTEADAAATLAPVLAEARHRLHRYLYAEDDQSLPSALAALLRQRALTLGVAEAGTGGRFGALLLGDADATDVVRGALAGPQDPTASAVDLARDARDRFAASIGIGLAAVLEPTDQGLHQGTVTVALAGLGVAEESIPLRAVFSEIQRRAALHSADVLRRALAETG